MGQKKNERGEEVGREGGVREGGRRREGGTSKEGKKGGGGGMKDVES